MKFDSNINQKMINFRPDMAEYPSQEQLLIFIIFSTNTHQSHMFSPRLAIFPETGNALADDITTRSVAATVKYVQACRAAYNMAMPTRFPLQLVLLQTEHDPPTPASSATNHPASDCARLLQAACSHVCLVRVHTSWRLYGFSQTSQACFPSVR